MPLHAIIGNKQGKHRQRARHVCDNVGYRGRDRRPVHRLTGVRELEKCFANQNQRQQLELLSYRVGDGAGKREYESGYLEEQEQ